MGISVLFSCSEELSRVWPDRLSRSDWTIESSCDPYLNGSKRGHVCWGKMRVEILTCTTTSSESLRTERSDYLLACSCSKSSRDLFDEIAKVLEHNGAVRIGDDQGGCGTA